MRLTKISAWALTLVGFFDVSAAWTNPVRDPGGSDPFVTWSGDGYYYLMTTTWTNLQISRSTTVAGLKSPETKVIYESTEADRCCNVWAPEVHWLGDRWYVYFTAGNADDLDGQRLHVLEGGSSPWDDFTYAGILTSEWAIDGSILRFSDYGNYFMFSCFHGVTYQSICLQQLGSDYVSLTGDITIISQPTESWETNAYPVNEGPAALYFNGQTMISYSASYCWDAGYCLGLLTWDGATNPASAAAWSKSDGCVLTSGNGNYGTGHNSFFSGSAGTDWWIAYHATDNPEGACDDSRYTMIQEIGTASDGGPDFGTPVSFTVDLGEPAS